MSSPYRFVKVVGFTLMALLVPLSFSGSTASPVGITVKQASLCASSGKCQEVCDPGTFECSWVPLSDGSWALCLGPEPVDPPKTD